MNTIIICLIVSIIGYCLINQIEVNELYAELDELKHYDEIALIKSRLLDLEQAKAVEDCPHNEILHYHHDGCPACYEHTTC